MQRRGPSRRDDRRFTIAAVALLAGSAAFACGLSTSGTEAVPDDGGAGDAGNEAVPLADGATSSDGARDVAGGSISPDAAGGDATGTDGADAAADAPCTPFDAGLGPLALSAFSLKGSAIYNDNQDGILTLTDSSNHLRGAAWYPTQLPPLAAYDLTWSLRVGPGDTAGDGIAFAIIQSHGMPGVGDDGDGIGLRNLADADGGAVSGYAVVVDMYKTSSDPTDLGPSTLKIFAMPGFRFVTGIAVPPPLNDGNPHTVDVSWRAPSALSATLHAPGGGVIRISSSDAALTTTGPAFLGFTGATGGGSDSHNEIAGVTLVETCN